MAAALAAVVLAAASCAGTKAGSKVIEPVDFSQVRINDSFWAPRLDSHKTATIPVCIDQIEVQTGRMRNFDKVAAGGGQTKASSSMILMSTRLSKALHTRSSSIPTRSLRRSATTGSRALQPRSNPTDTSTPSTLSPVPTTDSPIWTSTSFTVPDT